MKKNLPILIMLLIAVIACTDDDKIEIQKPFQAYIFIPKAATRQLRIQLSSKNLNLINSSDWKGEGDFIEFNLLTLQDNSLISANYNFDGPEGQVIESAFVAMGFDSSKDTLEDKKRPAETGTAAVIGDTFVKPEDPLRIDFDLIVEGKKLKGRYVGVPIFIYE